VVEKYSGNVVTQLGALTQTVAGFKNRMESLMTTLSGLQVIRVSGKIESAKMSSTGTSNFNVHIEGMEQFIQKIATPSKEVSTIIEKFVEELKNCMASLSKVERNLPALKEIPAVSASL
jgi:hypothetical protein